MKKTLNTILSVTGWIVTLLCITILVFSVWSFCRSQKTGDPVTIAGYRPVYVLTGSMEPFMKEHSIVITRQVSGLDDIRLNDVVTYHTEDENGKELVITHRVREINEDGTIVTKGDNNRVKDNVPITIDQIEAKVVFTCNWVASIVHLWADGRGKAIILAACAATILFFFALKTFLSKPETAR